MELFVIFGGLVVILLAWALFLGVSHPKTGRQLVGESLRSDEAEAEIEAVDIDQMIDARNERRRRAGRPEIGDELERRIRRGS